METTRQNKISRLLQKELSDIFLLMTKDKMRGTLISVSTVRVSPDLSLAKVYLSIFPSENTENVMAYIEEKKWNIRHDLAARVRFQLRKVPEIAFFADDSLDYLENIDKLLKQ
jgi:ribosome-binding factor A